MCTSALSQTTGNFYPRPPRGGRLASMLSNWPGTGISIHALREEGDLRSRPWQDRRRPISIHALRGEGDHNSTCPFLRPHNFYPRPPRGGRLADVLAQASANAFLSTPSARRATRCGFCPCPGRWNFYPHPPRGGRRQGLYHIGMLREISIHTLREEGDRPRSDRCCPAMRFLSTPSARRATLGPQK